MREMDLEKEQQLVDDLSRRVEHLALKIRRLALLWLLLAVLVALLLLVGCRVLVLPTQIVTTAGAAAAPTSSAAAPAVLPARFDRISVDIFEQFGCSSPFTGGSIVRVGCIARITATPTLGGAAVPPELHGTSCQWFVDGRRVSGSASTDVVYVTETSNPFNVVLHAQGLGTFTLEAVVGEIRSGVKGFVVVQ